MEPNDALKRTIGKPLGLLRMYFGNTVHFDFQIEVRPCAVLYMPPEKKGFSSLTMLGKVQGGQLRGERRKQRRQGCVRDWLRVYAYAMTARESGNGKPI